MEHNSIRVLDNEPTTQTDGSKAEKKKLTVKLSSNLFINLPEGLSEVSYQRIGKTRMIACFMIDGSDRYTAMTINAINSFLKSTPDMHAGVLIPPTWGLSIFATRVVPHLVAPERVVFKKWSEHFSNWNPTQYKLDLVQFASDYDVILWLDSDTIVYEDLRPLLFAFYKTPAKYMFVRDHVCYNTEFVQNWPYKDSHGSCFVPQACLMAFKAEHMKPLFDIWENAWREWIEPEPFKNHPDPLPSFHASRFCIEQYALGQALFMAETTNDDILEIARSNIVLNTRQPSVASSGPGGFHAAGGAGSSTGQQSEGEGATPSYSTALTTPTANINLNTSQYLSTSAFLALSFNLSSYPSSYLSSYPSSYLSSYSSFGLRGIHLFDGTTTRLVFNEQGNSNGQEGQSQSQSQSGQGQEGQSAQGSHNQGLPELLVVDHLGGSVVHFYNNFYELVHQWWEANEAAIVKALKKN